MSLALKLKKMIDIFNGDPFIETTPNGARFVFKSGQPVMDQGFENHTNLGLLTKPGWYGNDLEKRKERKYESRFLEISRRPINRQMLLDLGKETQRTEEGDEFGNVTATATNPTSQDIRVEIFYTAPDGTEQQLLLTRTGPNWISQRDNPAHRQVN